MKPLGELQLRGGWGGYNPGRLLRGGDPALNLERQDRFGDVQDSRR